MRLRLLLGGVAFALALTGACGPTTHPLVGPDTAWPCGLHGKSCGNHLCCGENDVCGFDGPFSRCEPGYCCYDGPHWPGASRDAGVPEKRRQWSEVSR